VVRLYRRACVRVSPLSQFQVCPEQSVGHELHCSAAEATVAARRRRRRPGPFRSIATAAPPPDVAAFRPSYRRDRQRMAPTITAQAIAAEQVFRRKAPRRARRSHVLAYMPSVRRRLSLQHGSGVKFSGSPYAAE